MLKRLNDLLDLPQKHRDYILYALDGLLRDAKAWKAYASKKKKAYPVDTE